MARAISIDLVWRPDPFDPEGGLKALTVGGLAASVAFRGDVWVASAPDGDSRWFDPTEAGLAKAQKWAEDLIIAQLQT